MAKQPNKPAAVAPANVTAAPSPFAVSWDVPIPARVGPGGAGKQPSPLMQAIRAMPAPQDGKFPTFFVPHDFLWKVPATITNPAEREKAIADNVRKLSSTISGITRRVVKSAPAGTMEFTSRGLTENDVKGVRVWRINPTPPAAA